MGGKIQGLTVVINGDATPLSRAMRQIKADATMARTHLASLGQLMKFDPSSAELAAQKQRLLGRAIAQNARAWQTYQEAHARYSANSASLTEAERTQMRSLEREMTRNRVEFARLRQEAVSFGAAASPGMIAFGNAAASASASMRTFANYALGASVGTALVGAAALNAAKDYEYAFADVRKTIDATEAEYDELSAAILEMSLRKPTSPEDIAYIMSLGGQLNIATEHLEKFADTTADLDVATNLDLDSASIDLARFMNITKTGQGDIDRLGATIVDLGNNSATTEADIMSMAMRIAGTGSSLGMTAAQVLAMATSLSSVGIQAEMGGNAISTVMRRIDSDVAKSSETLGVWAETAGMSAEEFRALWASDVSSAMFEVFKGMGRIQDEGGNLTLLLDDMGISYMRQVDVMMRMAQAGDMGAAMMTRANNAWEQNSALAREVSQRYDTAEAKMQMMRNAAQVAAVTFGEELLPEFSGIVVGASELAQALGALDSGTKATVIDVAAAAVGFGLLTKAVQVGTGVVGAWARAAASAKTALSGWAEQIHNAAAVQAARAQAQAADTAAQAGNAAATAANSASQAANAAATGEATASKHSNTAAQATNTAAVAANAAASGAATVKTGALASAVLGLSSAMGISTAASAGLLGVLGLLGAAALVGVVASAKAAEDAAVRSTAATRDLAAAQAEAQAGYDRAAASFGEGSDEALKAAHALAAATAAYDNGRESVGEYCERLGELDEAYGQTRASMEQASSDADASAGAMLSLSDRLLDAYESMDAGTEKTATMLSLIDSLGEAAGDLGLAYDEASDSLLLNNEAVRDYRAAIGEVVKAQADQRRYEAASKNYSSALQAQIDLETELAVAERELADAREAAESYTADAWGGRAGAIRSMSAEARAAKGDAAELDEKVTALAADVEDARAKQAAYIDTMARLKTEELAVAEAVRLHQGESMSLEDAVARVNATSGTAITAAQVQAQIDLEAAEAASQLAAADEELEEAVQKVADGLYDLMGSNAVFSRFMADSGLSVESLAAAMHDAGTDADDLRKRMEEFAEATANGLKEIEEARTAPKDEKDDDWVDAARYERTLDENFKVAERWNAAMTDLYDRHGDEASRAFLDSMAQMGYEYTPLMEQFSSLSDAEWSRLVGKWQRNLDQGYADALVSFGAFAEQYGVAAGDAAGALDRAFGGDKAAAQGLMEAIEGLGAQAQPALAALASMTDEQLAEVAAAYGRGGVAAVQAYIDSLGSKSGEAQAAAREAVAGAEQAVDDGAGEWSTKVVEKVDAAAQGVEAAKGTLAQAMSGAVAQMAAAVDEGAPAVAASADALSKLAADRLSSAKGDAAQAGRSMGGEHFPSGISQSTGPVAASADALSKLAADRFSSAKAAARSAGYSMAQGFAAGIRSGTALVAAASSAMSRQVPDSAKKAGEVNSPSKVMMRLGPSWPEGMAAGIRRGTAQVERAGAEMARAAERGAGRGSGASRLALLADPPSALAALAAARSAPRAAEPTSVTHNYYTINGLTWDDGSSVARAMDEVAHQVLVRRRS